MTIEAKNNSDPVAAEICDSMICVTCPRGCRMELARDEEGQLQVRGNFCKRGIAYAKNELTDPRRMVASTVRIADGVHRVLPVATTDPIPKGQIEALMALLNETVTEAPVRMGDVIVANALGCGIDVVASRSMARRDS